MNPFSVILRGLFGDIVKERIIMAADRKFWTSTGSWATQDPVRTLNTLTTAKNAKNPFVNSSRANSGSAPQTTQTKENSKR